MAFYVIKSGAYSSRLFLLNKLNILNTNKMKLKLIYLTTILFMIVLGSCGGQKAYTQRSSGINGKTGSHTVAKTQSYYNKEASDRRFKKNNGLTVLGITIFKR